MSKYTPILIIACLLFVVYIPLFGSFYQQDEWLAFGFHYLVEKQGLSSFLTNAFIPRLGHYSPLNYIFEFLLFLIIRLNFWGWATVSLVMHTIASVLVFKIARNWLKPKLALLAACIFAVSAVHVQATAWPVADIGTHGATIFALLSFLFWIRYCNKPDKKYFIPSMIFLGVSLLFKELAIGLFVLLPIYWFMFAKGRKKLFAIFKPMFLLFVIFFGIRVLAVIVPNEAYVGTIYDQKPSVAQTQALSKFVYNAVTFPVKAVTQSIVPTDIIVALSNSVAELLPENISGQQYTSKRDIFVLKYIVEIINFTFFAVILALSMKVGKKAVFALIFIMVNSVVFALSPEKTGRITIIDSRNLYLISVMSALLLVFLVQYFKPRYILLFFSVLIFGYSVLTFSYVNNLSAVGSLRKKIVEQIKKDYPDLPNKTVIYTQSDSSYYGLAEETRIMPFQSGFGQTLIIWYYSQEQFPSEMLEKKFLWEITDQGYLQIEDKGFGYFWDFESLKSKIKQDSLDPEAVIAYSFYSNSNTLEDISQDIRTQIENGR